MNYIYLIPALPLAGFLVLGLLGGRLSKKNAAVIGVGSVGSSAFLSILIAASFLSAPPAERVVVQTLWTWMEIGNFAPSVSLSLDALSLLMVLVITVVGFLIHLYSAEFMKDDESYGRFFAWMNLFVAAMLVLVLADDLLLLYLGWEGVGLCSYLLIGFWYRDPLNGRAARKAFIVTRVGDTALAIGLFLLFTELGTLNIRELMQAAQQQWPLGSPLATAAAALLLGGAVGKSAQLPLQVWLPDAMAGPTPVSALIHAATMVTAGVYLVARTHVLFSLAPAVQTVIAFIGAATLLIAGLSALAQRDIKRVLAYSTISQIGYMFLALGAGAWTAALFHFLTHAFFKALLFLAAGAVILAQHQEHDLFKMGGLRKELPAVFWTFFIGAASLSALPLITAGFYSKDMILWAVWTSPLGGNGLMIAGLAGAFITSLYAFRMLFLAFFGMQKMPVSSRPGVRMLAPLVVLAILSVIGGFIELPGSLHGWTLFTDHLSSVFPLPAAEAYDHARELMLQTAGAAAGFAGIFIAYLFYYRNPELIRKWSGNHAVEQARKFLLAGWDFDALYDRLFVRPFVWIAHINRNDVIDRMVDGISWSSSALHGVLSRTQTGSIRWYAMGIAAGAIVLLGIVLLLA